MSLTILRPNSRKYIAINSLIMSKNVLLRWVNVGYAYPPVVFYSYIPGSSKSGGVQALGYEGSPKVSPSIPFGSMGKKTGSSLIAPSPAPTSTGGGGGGTSSSGAGQSNSAGANSTGGNGMTTPVPSAVY